MLVVGVERLGRWLYTGWYVSPFSFPTFSPRFLPSASASASASDCASASASASDTTLVDWRTGGLAGLAAARCLLSALWFSSPARQALCSGALPDRDSVPPSQRDGLQACKARPNRLWNKRNRGNSLQIERALQTTVYSSRYVVLLATLPPLCYQPSAGSGCCTSHQPTSPPTVLPARGQCRRHPRATCALRRSVQLTIM